jgi:H+/Cl- antiporter ClcA
MPREPWLRALAEQLALGGAVGVSCGVASALFLRLLELATGFRNEHEHIVYALPFAGLVIGWLYERLGQRIKGGNNLLIDTVHDGGPQVPRRMAPMVLIGTVLTHLFGGSAGREGTAVQMGASLADFWAHRFDVSRARRRQLLLAGMAGGFGSVFGTPLAGVLFGLEVARPARLELRALLPALVASFAGNFTTQALGIQHARYPQVAALALSWLVLGKWLVFAAAVALTTLGFIELTHAIKRYGERLIPRLPLRMLLGGVAVVALWRLLGSSDYLGLGVPTILRAFHDPALPRWAFAAKLGLTAITLGAGFLGGEVTPLFFIGAALGNALASGLGLPLALAAGVGMASMFGAAANTPLALSIMAAELLGLPVLPHVALVCGLAFLVTRTRTIYPAQLKPRDLPFQEPPTLG